MTVVRIGLLLGDPAGVGPEIAAKLLADANGHSNRRYIVIGTEAVLAEGARVADVDLRLPLPRASSAAPNSTNPVLLPIADDEARDIPLGEVSRAAGLYQLRSLQRAVEAAKAGEIDAVVYAPLNKHAMSLAGLEDIDEMHYLARLFACRHFCTE